MPEQQPDEEVTLHCVVKIQPWAFKDLDKEAFSKAIDAELFSTMVDMKQAFMEKYDELHGG